MAKRIDTEVGFPFQLDTRGRAADPKREDHIRQMIELVLFPSPGERVNRPEFGCGLLELIFGPETEQEAIVTQNLVRGALQRWLGDLLSVEDLKVDAGDNRLDIRIEYQLLGIDEPRVATFELRDLPWNS